MINLHAADVGDGLTIGSKQLMEEQPRSTAAVKTNRHAPTGRSRE
jgi:hypothetical protein